MLGNGRADDRRRRVLTEELIGAKAPSEAAVEAGSRNVSGGKPRNRYGDSARMDRSPRIIDLLPRGYGLLAGVAFGGALAIAALEAGHYYLPLLAPHSATGRLPALELAGHGTLASWFTTTLLSFAAAVAAIVYSLRKHRADDYHGRYRIWLAAACACVYLGVDESASLHETIRDLAVGLSGQAVLGSGAIWWIGAYALVLGVIGVRLVLDLRECRTSTTVFTLATIAASATIVSILNGELHWFALPGIDVVMLERGLVMSAALLLLTSLLVHARYVVLEAEGEITPRPAKPKKAKEPKAEKTKAAAKESSRKDDDGDDEPQEKRSLFGFLKRAKIDPPHTTPAPTRKTSDLQTTAKSTSQVPSSAFQEVRKDEDRRPAKVNKVRADFSEMDDEDDDDDHDNRKLSKAQRKALRRQKEMERRSYGE